MTQIFEIEDDLDQFYATLLSKNMTKMYKFDNESHLFKYINERIPGQEDEYPDNEQYMLLEGIIIDGKVHGRAKIATRDYNTT